MTSEKPVNKTASMILGFLIFVGIPLLLLLAHCGFTAEFKMGGTIAEDKSESLLVQNIMVSTVMDSDGNNFELFSCEFRTVYEREIFSFRSVNGTEYDRRLVEACSVLRPGEFSRFRIVQSVDSGKITVQEIYWYPEGAFATVEGIYIGHSSE